MRSSAEILREIDDRGLTEHVSDVAAKFQVPLGEIAIPMTDAGRKARVEAWASLRDRGMRAASLGRIWGVPDHDVIMGIEAWQGALRPTLPAPPPSAPGRAPRRSRAELPRKGARR